MLNSNLAKKQVPYKSRKTKMINLLEAIPLPKPLASVIELSGVCNFRCIFCPQSTDIFKESDRAKYMSIETFYKALSDINCWGGSKLKTLALSDVGEPLLNPNFANMISKSFESLCDYSVISTNASMLKGDKAEAILESDLNYLRISIYAVIQEKHEKITQSKIDINEIYENVASFKSKRDALKKGPQIYIKMIDAFSEEKEIFLNKYEPLADEIKIETLMNWNGCENFVEKANVKNFIPPEKTREVCPFPFFKIHIHNNGDVSFCCADYMGDLAFENICNNSLEEIWHSQSLRKLQTNFLQRKQQEYSACRKCDFFNTDRGSANIDSLTAEEFLRRFDDKK